MSASYLPNPHNWPVWQELADELDAAMSQHGPMASGHEAQSVIAEEFHEFTLAVWFGVDQHGKPADPRYEALQVAAMALRYIHDVADHEVASPQPCPSCSGKGWTIGANPLLSGEPGEPYQVQCSDCGGTGEVAP